MDNLSDPDPIDAELRGIFAEQAEIKPDPDALADIFSAIDEAHAQLTRMVTISRWAVTVAAVILTSLLIWRMLS